MVVDIPFMAFVGTQEGQVTFVQVVDNLSAAVGSSLLRIEQIPHSGQIRLIVPKPDREADYGRLEPTFGLPCVPRTARPSV